MKHKVKIAIYAIFLSIDLNSILHAAKPSQSVNDPSLNPRLVAEAGLYSWVNNFTVSNVQPGKDFVLDVKSLRELQSVYLGRSLAMKVVDSNQLISGRTLQQATHPNGELRFVVMAGRRPVGLAIVREILGKYEFTGLGGKALAKDIEATLAAFPARETSLVRSHQALQDYVELTGGDAKDAQYAQLQSTTQKEQINRNGNAPSIDNRAASPAIPDLMTGAVLASKLREAISRNAAMEGNWP